MAAIGSPVVYSPEAASETAPRFPAVSERFEVVCGPLVAGGDCLVRRDGEKTMFVNGAIPGERVAVEIVEERKDLVRAECVEVIESSPLRVEPSALLPLEAGGAEWQHISPDAQLQFKVDIARDSLQRIAKIAQPEVVAGKSVSPDGYRTTMRFGVVDGNVAMRKKQSNDLVAIDACTIAHPRLRELFDCDFKDATEVTLRVSNSSIARAAWIRGEVDDLQLPADVQVTNNGRNATISESVCGRDWQISAQSFFQSGPQAAALLCEAVNARIHPDAGWVIDLYSGIGLLGGTVAAERSCQLTCVEQSKSSIRDARHNLSDLAAEIIEAEVATVSPAGSAKPDVVIADPPRTGLGKSAAKAVAGIDAPQVVLVSCDPASLARDVVLLAGLGYEFVGTEVLDLFPQTSQLEAVSTFSKAASK